VREELILDLDFLINDFNVWRFVTIPLGNQQMPYSKHLSERLIGVDVQKVLMLIRIRKKKILDSVLILKAALLELLFQLVKALLLVKGEGIIILIQL
jgi:hypothetical protein